MSLDGRMLALKVVVDSWTWYTFSVQKEQFHKQAIDFLYLWPELVIVITVFEEVIALLHHRMGLKIYQFSPFKQLRNSQLKMVP